MLTIIVDSAREQSLVERNVSVHKSIRNMKSMFDHSMKHNFHKPIFYLRKTVQTSCSSSPPTHRNHNVKFPAIRI